MAQKIALLIGSSDYMDSKLSQLKGPALDVEHFAKVLKDPKIGAFDQVDVLVNKPMDDVRRKVFDLFDDREREDLVLLYISGHGVLDLQGRLFFAISNTEFNRLPITALRANEVQEHMNETRSRRQVLILDCCHSGAFYEGARHGPQNALTQQTFDVRGHGREVLTASTATQYAFEGDEFVEGGTPRGLGTFTHYLIEGLETGAAAPESKEISVLALFDYAARQVKATNTSMTPQRWSDFRDDQPLFIASNPHLQSSILKDIREGLRSEDYKTRLGAVIELCQRATNDAGLARATVVELQDIRVHERDVSVCTAIDQHLPALRRMIENQVTDSGAKPQIVRMSKPTWEPVAIFAAGIMFVLILVAIALFMPDPTAFQMFIFRIILALAAGAVGALIPGLLDVQFRGWLRAGGAITLFVLVYFINPPQLVVVPVNLERSEEVTKIQAGLVELSCLEPYMEARTNIDGHWGESTKAAFAQFANDFLGGMENATMTLGWEGTSGFYDRLLSLIEDAKMTDRRCTSRQGEPGSDLNFGEPVR